MKIFDGILRLVKISANEAAAALRAVLEALEQLARRIAEERKVAAATRRLLEAAEARRIAEEGKAVAATRRLLEAAEARIIAEERTIAALRTAAQNKFFLIMAYIGLLLIIAVVVAFSVFGARRAIGIGGSTFIVTPGPRAAVGERLAQAPQSCGLEFIHPTSDGQIPLQGPLNIAWSNVEYATSYALEVKQPAGAGNPWELNMSETSKQLYMENFPAGGEYQFVVTAVGADGVAICSAAFKFEKQANLYVSPPDSTGASEASPADSNGDPATDVSPPEYDGCPGCPPPLP